MALGELGGIWVRPLKEKGREAAKGGGQVSLTQPELSCMLQSRLSFPFCTLSV